MKRYTTEQPRFAGFALVAAAFWSLALAMRLTAALVSDVSITTMHETRGDAGGHEDAVKSRRSR